MGETTKIEWADATVNFWHGCTKVSPACTNCYAETLSKRWGKDVWGPGKPREDHRVGARKLAMRLQRQAVREGRRLRVFSASMADWLDPEVPAEWLADMLAVVAATPGLDWLLLTKRPHMWRERMEAAFRVPGLSVAGAALIDFWLNDKAPENVWVGCTVEDQEHAERRIPELLAIPARVRFVSCEPLLGPVDLSAYLDTEAPCPLGCAECDHRIGWVITGGESGRGARPSHPDWFRSLRDQATSAGVAYFLKQLGGHPDKHGDIDAFPEDLRVREVPRA